MSPHPPLEADKGRAFPVTAVDLGTDHRKEGVVDVVVRIEIQGQWVEVIRTPYPDGGVIGHAVYSLGIEQQLPPGHPASSPQVSPEQREHDALVMALAHLTRRVNSLEATTHKPTAYPVAAVDDVLLLKTDLLKLGERVDALEAGFVGEMP